MPTGPLDLLHPRVLAFARRGFSLGSDLGNLLRVHALGSHEAAVFYGGRIVEALSAHAVERVGAEAGEVYSNLLLLEQLDQLAEPWRSWAHALRRLGNEARHLRRLVGPEDARSAVGLVAAWLDWFFLRFPRGTGPERLAALTSDARPLRLPGAEALGDALASILPGAAPDLDRLEVAAERTGSPVLLAFVLEQLIGQGSSRAAALVRRLEDQQVDDLRLRQLVALHYSRRGDGAEGRANLEKADALLSALLRDRPQDEETLGLLGGVHKRAWRRDGGLRLAKDHPSLLRARAAYRRGWVASRERNAYLGVNLAATLAWTGELAQSAKVAGEVLTILRARARLLDGARFEFWSEATLAEALLLAGDLEGSRATYAAALARPEAGLGNAGVARAQRSLLCEALAVDPGLFRGDEVAGD